MKNKLINKIDNKSAKIGILGLGYVGLPHLINFVNRGFFITGYDTNTARVDSLNNQTSYVEDVVSIELEENKNRYTATSNFSSLGDQDIIFIDVPTPILRNKTPDFKYIKSASETILKYARKGQIIILESTVSPGTTYKYLVESLNTKGFNVGEDIFVGYSPERIDPGNKDFKQSEIIRIISGYTENCLDIMKVLFKDKGYPVSSLELAELAKLYENTFRFINIAFVNEMSRLTENMNLSFDELTRAANSKQYGFMSFNPSYGVGGHCIPVDPFYLLDYAYTHDVNLSSVINSSAINDSMIYRLIRKIEPALESSKYKNPSLALIGASYKPNIKDTRMSLANELADYLVDHEINFAVFDNISHDVSIGIYDTPINKIDYKEINKHSLAIILQEHDYIDIDKITIDKIFATRF